MLAAAREFDSEASSTAIRSWASVQRTLKLPNEGDDHPHVRALR